MSYRLAQFGILTAGLVGCSGSSADDIGGTPEGHVPVSGKVLLDGQPLAGAIVSFPTAASSGVTDTSGHFELYRGAKSGPHRVVINKPEAPADPKAPPMPGTVKETLPDKYSGPKSELKFDVPAGGSKDANFDLKSK